MLWDNRSDNTASTLSLPSKAADIDAHRAYAAAAVAAPAAHEPGGAHHGVYGGAHDSWADHRHAVAEHLSHGDHGGAHHPRAGGHGSDRHVGQASHDGAHASSAAAPHGGDAHEPAPSSTGSASAASDHH